jgi:hypothetical protein
MRTRMKKMNSGGFDKFHGMCFAARGETIKDLQGNEGTSKRNEMDSR